MYAAKMYIIWLFCLLAYFGSPRNFVESTRWVDDLVSQIVENLEFRQVKIMTRLDDNAIIENPLFDELCEKLTQNLPTLRINFGENFEFPVNSVSDETVQARTPIDTSATLFLLVIESRNSLPITTTKKNFINAVAEMASYHYDPKYLMISFVPEKSNSFEELLLYAWAKKMLDFTIIELVQPELPRRSILVESSVASPMMYQLNFFKKEYVRKVMTGIDDLFPSKVDNLWGHRLRIRIGSAMPSILLDVNMYVTSIFAKKLGSSRTYIPRGPSNASDVWRSMYINMEEENFDLQGEPEPYFLSNGWNHTLKTVPTILHDAFCAVVPIKRISKRSVSANVIAAYILSFSIILIFWLFMKLLSFQTYPWRMFNIGRVLFGISIAQQPRGNVERIIFTCLLAIFAMYSSTIYASITDITMETEDEVEFKSLADLDS
ncbi:uncharacterized protein [Venturia canescens]|uniref:uncharacterized protein n=1 Tax=Venturia canescens TaxID=32260 RepID=UPI001C9BDE55|nr:uncharacterized protein LOC122410223 [Venturia canescens]